LDEQVDYPGPAFPALREQALDEAGPMIIAAARAFAAQG